MRKLIAVLSVMGAIITVMLGSIHWNKQVMLKTKELSATKESDVHPKKTKESSPAKESEPAVQENTLTIIEKKVKRALPTYFPASLHDRLQTKQQLSLTVIGDAATSSATEGWSARLKEILNQAYGEEVWTVTVQEWSRESAEGSLTHKLVSEIATLKPDIILVEVPLSTDSLETEANSAIRSIESILHQLKTQLPDCTVVLQPSDPVYNAKYPKEIEELKQFAEQNQYLYNNHWSPWLSASSEELLSYLKNNNGLSNEKSQELRGQAVSRYFTGE